MESLRLTLVFIFFTILQLLHAQDATVIKNPPISVEPMVSGRGIYIQSLISKKFQSLPEFGFFSASGILNEWHADQAYEVMTQSYLTFSVIKEISLNAGFHYSQVTGMRPTLGISYTYAGNKWFATVFPRVDIASKSNLETFGMVEYKPKITPKINFYSRIQGTFIHNLKENHHERSYAYFRAGISFKEFTLGGACNIDYYGKMKSNENSSGIFLMIRLY